MKPQLSPTIMKGVWLVGLIFGAAALAAPGPSRKEPPRRNAGVLPAGPIVAGELRLDDATKERGGIASGGSAEATVFDQPNDSGFGWFMKQDDVFGYSTWASQAVFANGFMPGDSVSSYEMTFFHSTSDDESYGDATVSTELWDGDPMSVMETICTTAGVSAPIPGTQATFSGIPYNTVARLRAELPTKATVDCDRVWIAMTMVEGCRGTWRIPGTDGGTFNAQPTVGSGNGVWLLWACEQFGGCDTETGYNSGTCCAFGPGDPNEVCDHANVDGGGNLLDPCATEAAAGITFCGDGVADYFVANINEPGLFRGLVSSVSAATDTIVQLVPVSVDAPPAVGGSSSGVVSLSGNELVLEDGDHNIWLEFRIGDWDPDDSGAQLAAWQLKLDASTLNSGDQGKLTPYIGGGPGTCVTNADCEDLLGPGGACDPPGYYLNAQLGSGICSYLFIDGQRDDFVYSPAFGTQGAILVTDLCCLDVRPAGTVIIRGPDDPEPFPDGGLYAATLTLHVPADAKGTFFVSLKAFPESQLVDQFGEFIPLLGTRPATITVQTGRCCFDIDSPNGSGCLDTLMTANTCAQMPGATEFLASASCVDTDACPNPPGRCCSLGGCSDSVSAASCEEMPGGAGIFTTNGSCSDAEACSELLGRCCSNIGSPEGPDCDEFLTAGGCAEMPGLTSFELGGSCVVANPCFDCGAVNAPAEPALETHAIAGNSRYLSVVAPEPGVEIALHVTLVESDLFPLAAGMSWWVGAPSVYCENGSVATPPCPPVSGIPSSSFLSSNLQCEPQCMDFGSLGEVLHIGDPNIVPSARYEIRAISCSDGAIDRTSCSEPLTIATSAYADVLLSCAECPCEPPEGAVNIIDCKAVIDRLVSAPCAPIKARVDLEPATPDRQINITDVLQCLTIGFQGGLDYDLSQPERCK